MEDTELLNDIYDVLAQNNDMVKQDARDNITNLIDHVDSDRKAIVFINSKGEEFELRLTKA
jgi:hypothetical protein